MSCRKAAVPGRVMEVQCALRGAVLSNTATDRPYHRSAPLTIDELELQPPGPGEVLVRIEAAASAARTCRLWMVSGRDRSHAAGA